MSIDGGVGLKFLRYLILGQISENKCCNHVAYCVKVSTLSRLFSEKSTRTNLGELVEEEERQVRASAVTIGLWLYTTQTPLGYKSMSECIKGFLAL